VETLEARQLLSLPPGWFSQDIGTTGDPAAAGEANWDGTSETSPYDGTFALFGGGTDIWNVGTAGNYGDHFHYAYTEMEGDGEIVANVAYLEPYVSGTSDWTKAGVMMRASTEAGSQHVMNVVSSTYGVAWQGRPSPGAGSVNAQTSSGERDGTWVKIIRTGNTFTGQYSVDSGASWSDFYDANYNILSRTWAFPNKVLVGLAVTSHDNTRRDEAWFDNVSITSTADANVIGAPTSLVATGGTNGKDIILNWFENASNETGFTIERSTTADFSDNVVQIPAAGSDLHTLTDDTVVAGVQYYYRIQAHNDVASSDWSNITTFMGGAVTGLTGRYFNNPFWNGEATVTRVDPAMDLYWADGVRPAATISPHYNSARWTGRMLATKTGTYTIMSRTDDQGYLWMNDDQSQRVVSMDASGGHAERDPDPALNDPAATDRRQWQVLDDNVRLTEGQYYNLVLDYSQGTGASGVEIVWIDPDGVREIVPAANFITTMETPAAATSLSAVYHGSYVDLSWTDNSVSEMKFLVERATQADFSDAKVVAQNGYNGTTAVDVDLDPSTRYYYRVRAWNYDGSSVSEVAQVDTNATIPLAPGLLGEYYDGFSASPPPQTYDPYNPESSWNPALFTTRLDEQVDFVWGRMPGTPVEGMKPNNFFIRWEGTVIPPVDGDYYFGTSADDGNRLWVKGQLMVNLFSGNSDQAATPRTISTTPVSLKGGVPAPIILDAFDNEGDAAAHIWWQGPIAQEKIPPGSLMGPITSAPAAATNLTAAAGPISMNITFTDNAISETYTRVEMSRDNGATWEVVRKLLDLDGGLGGTSSLISNTNGAATTSPVFTVSGLSPNSTYKYRVIEGNFFGETMSAELTASTADMPPGVLTPSVQTDVAGNTNLTAEGNLDWGHWGFDQNAGGFNTKVPAGVSKAALQRASEKYVAWEAENGEILTLTGVPWSLETGLGVDGIGPSGGAALRAPSTTSNLTYRFYVSQPGDYKVYVRRKVIGGSDNSIHMSAALDVASNTTLNRIFDDRNSTALNGTYLWTGSDGVLPTGYATNNPTTYTSVTAGLHTLTLARRETNYVLDRIVLVKQGEGNDAPTAAWLNARANSALTRSERPITNVSVVGSGTATAYNVTGKTFTWSDGSPTASVTATDDGIAVSGVGNGFRFTAPASTVSRRLKVYVAVDGTATGQIKAGLSDSSVLDYTGTLTATGSLKTARYTFEYQSGLDNRQIVVEWTQTGGVGKVILQAADWIEYSPPAAASNVSATATVKSTVQLSWQDNSNSESGFRIERAPSGSGTWLLVGTAAADATTFADRTVEPGMNYDYRVVATNAFSNGPASNVATVTTTQFPTPWEELDIGIDPTDPDVGDSGANAAGTEWYVKGGGWDMWERGTDGATQDDEFHYVYQPVSGDVRITARLTGLENTTDGWGKGGVHFRESLDNPSRDLSFAGTLANQSHMQGRDMTTGVLRSFSGGAVGWNMRPSTTVPTPAPQWLRLERIGTTMSAYWSADGITWQLAPNAGTGRTSPIATDWGQDFYAGLAVTSHNNVDVGGWYTTTAAFDNVLIEQLDIPVAAPTKFTVTAISGDRIILNWVDHAVNEIGYTIQRTGSDGSADPIDVGANTNYYEDTGRAGVTYTYKLFATGWNDKTSPMMTGTARAGDGVTPAPSPWHDLDIGNPGISGGSGYLGGVFDVVGSGGDIWTSGGVAADSFHFTYQDRSDLQGDFVITGQIRSQQRQAAWSKAGFMIRAGTDDGSGGLFLDGANQGAIMTAITATPDHGVQYLWREQAGGGCGEVHTGPDTPFVATAGAPAFLRLARHQGVVSGWISEDGALWRQLDGVHTVPGSTVYVGMGVTATNNVATSLATFKDVAITPYDATLRPEAPSDLTVRALGAKNMVLTWVNHALTATGYKIERATQADFADAVVVGTPTVRETAEFVDRTINADRTYYYRIIATNANAAAGSEDSSPSTAVSASRGVNGSPIKMANFADVSGWQINGNTAAVLAGADAVLRLTSATNNMLGSAFTLLPQDITKFSASFDFLMGSNATGAEGFTFSLQGVAPTAVGTLGGGGGLGFNGLAHSMGIKFDIYEGSEHAIDETGLYFNGAFPDLADPNGSDVDLRPTLANLLGTKWHVVLAHDGTTLTESIARADDPANFLFTHSWTVNLPDTMGVDCAYVGFTGRTGGANVQQDIYNLSFVGGGAPVAEDWIIDLGAGNDVATLKRAGEDVKLLDKSGNVAAQKALSLIKNIIVNGQDGDDALALDLSAGALVGTGNGLTFNGGIGNDTVAVVGGNAGEAMTVHADQITVGTLSIALSDVQSIGLKQVNGSSVTVGTTAAVGFDATASLAALSVLDSSTVTLTAGGEKVLKTGALSIGLNAALDLNDGDMIVTATAATRAAVYANVLNWIKSGRAGGTWAGKGLTSSTAKLDAKKYTGLASMINDKGGGEGAWYLKFDGIAVTKNDILVKYSWNGDANLDGVVNADDYFRIDSGFITQVGGFQNGDLNYDGVVNADDYFLIDKAFLGQTGKLAADEAAEDVVIVQQAAKKQDEPSVLSQLFSDVPVL